jgi:hypothetical protein
MYARVMPIQPRPDSGAKAQPILFSARSLPYAEGAIKGTRMLPGARNGRICVFPSDKSGKPGIFVQHELKIAIPDESKTEAPLPARPEHKSEEARRRYYDGFKQLVISRTPGRKDALGVLEWDFYPKSRQFYLNSIATAGNGPSKEIDAFSILMKEAERLARMIGAGSIMLHSETILAAKLLPLGYHLVPRERGFLPEYMKRLF